MMWWLLPIALAKPGWDPVLHADPYRFCNEAGAKPEEAYDWCELMKDVPADRCPGLRATCDGAPKSTKTDDLWEDLRGCSSEGDRGLAAPPDPPRRMPEGCDVPKTPQAGSPMALLRWVSALLVAAVLLIVLRLIIGYVGRYSRPMVAQAVPTAQGVAVPLDHEVPDVPSADLLAAARQALAQGKPGDAVLLARGAALRRLGEAGRLTLHRARTDREYLRAIRENPELQQALREVVAAAEQHRWGGVSIGVDTAKGALTAAERLIAGAGGVLLLIAAFESDARADRYDPYGDAALVELFQQGGYDATWRLRGLQTLTASDADVLVLDHTEVGTAPEDDAALRAWMEAGGLLIVAGDTAGIADEIGVWTMTDGDDGAIARRGSLPSEVPSPVWSGPVDYVYVGPDPTGSWVIADDGAVVVARNIGDGGIIAVSDSRLLSNGALIAQANEAFLLKAPYAGHDAALWTIPLPATVQFALRAGDDSKTPWGALRSAHLLPFMAQFMLLCGLIAWWRGWPLGPLRDPPESGRIAFVEHVRALGLRYQRLRATRRAFGGYAALWLQRLGPEGLELAALRAGLDAEAAKKLVAKVEAAANAPEGANDPSDLATMEELWNITQHRT